MHLRQVGLALMCAALSACGPWRTPRAEREIAIAYVRAVVRTDTSALNRLSRAAPGSSALNPCGWLPAAYCDFDTTRVALRYRGSTDLQSDFLVRSRRWDSGCRVGLLLIVRRLPEPRVAAAYPIPDVIEDCERRSPPS